MKLKLFLSVFLLMTFLTACGGAEEETPTDDTATEENTETEDPAEEETDVVTTASIVSEPDAFMNAVSENGTWIIATLNDLTFEEDITVAGQFHDKGDEANDIYRKIAAYEQDEDHNITESYTITVPNLIVQSENLRFQGGTLSGDVIVEANGFNLHESATVDGNIYFASEEYQESAVIDGEVTGEQAVQ